MRTNGEAQRPQGARDRTMRPHFREGPLTRVISSMSEYSTAQDRRSLRSNGAGTRRRAQSLLLCAGLLVAVSGCRNYNNYAETIGQDTTWVDRVAHEVDAGAPPGPIDDPLIRPVTLRTIDEQGEPTYWDVTLEEIIAHAMANSKVLRDLGGTILTSPQAIATQYTRPLQQTDPRFGMEAALSQFDAQLNALATFQHNHRVFNNRFLGGGSNLFRQDRHDYVTELSKLSATGAQLSLRNVMDYDDNNAPGNIFGSAWQTQWEGEIRQPLLQGAGLTYNRIAGPGGLPGVPNGVLIAKVNQDMTAADFNLAIRNYLSDVVNAYWDLYYSYRDLDAKQLALERARDIWQSYEAEKVADRKGGVAEALSREQFFRFQSELEDAIAGRAGQRTQARNGATGGAFRGVNGVQAAERRLRLLIGFPVNDNRVLRPSSDPELAPVVFDWESMAGEAVYRRPELQKQRLLVKRREMELIASRNFLQPQLDLYGKYRLRGLGHNLTGNDQRAGLRSAYGELGSAEFREWELGVQFNMPIGFRQGHAAVQNAELQLSRDRAVMKEQERQVLHDLSNMVAEVDRAWKQCQTNLNRYLAAKDAVEALEANREAGLPVNLEQVLDAHRRLSEAQSQYYLARTEYAVAIKNVHLEKGSLLEYGNVMLVDNAPRVDYSIETAAGQTMLASQPKATAPTTGTPTKSPIALAEAESPVATESTEAAPEEGGRVTISLVDPETLAVAPLGSPIEEKSDRARPTPAPPAPQAPPMPLTSPADWEQPPAMPALAPSELVESRPVDGDKRVIFVRSRPESDDLETPVSAAPFPAAPTPTSIAAGNPESKPTTPVRRTAAGSGVPLPPPTDGVRPASFESNLLDDSDSTGLFD